MSRNSRDSLLGIAALVLALAYLIAFLLQAAAAPWGQAALTRPATAQTALFLAALLCRAAGFLFAGRGFLSGAELRSPRIRAGASLIGVGYLFVFVDYSITLGTVSLNEGTHLAARLVVEVAAELALAAAAFVVAFAFAGRASPERLVARSRVLGWAAALYALGQGALLAITLRFNWGGLGLDDGVGVIALVAADAFSVLAGVVGAIGFLVYGGSGFSIGGLGLACREARLRVVGVLLLLYGASSVTVDAVNGRSFGADWRTNLYLAAPTVRDLALVAAAVLTALAFSVSLRAPSGCTGAGGDTPGPTSG